MNGETFICDICGEEHAEAACTYWDDQCFCPTCLDTLTTLCRDCGERVYRDQAIPYDSEYLCPGCFEDYYTTCQNCGEVIPYSYAYTVPGCDGCFCEDCYNDLRSGDAIHEYSYKPAPIFYGTGPRYFGVELEIDLEGEDNTNAERLLEIANQYDEHLYCKHDGSLDDGFELVSHPMSISYHCRDMPWQDVMRTAVRMGYRSHQTDTCGLHVHVSRKALGATEEEQDAVIARLLYFFEKHWEELLKFSRRTARQMDRWAARYGYQERPKEILDHAKKAYGSGRYASINLQNRATIEFRIFCGTLKYNTLIATLQFIDLLCDLATNLTDQQIQNLSWTTFAARKQRSFGPWRHAAKNEGPMLPGSLTTLAAHSVLINIRALLIP